MVQAGAQVLDPGAARVDHLAQRRDLGDEGQQRDGGVGGLLQRGAVMGGAERDGDLQRRDPGVAAGGAHMARGPADQPAHRMADQVDALHGDRPAGHELLEHVGQAAAVVGDRQTGVGPHEHGAGAQRVAQAGGVGPAAGLHAQPPGVLALAQAVGEDDDAPGGVRIGVGDRVTAQRQVAPAHADRHRHRQRAVLRGQAVAQPAVQRRLHRRAARRGAEPAVGQACRRRRARGAPGAAHTGVDRPGDRVVHPAGGARAGGAERPVGDRPVQLLDARGQAGGAVGRDRGQRADLGGRRPHRWPLPLRWPRVAQVVQVGRR